MPVNFVWLLIETLLNVFDKVGQILPDCINPPVLGGRVASLGPTKGPIPLLGFMILILSSHALPSGLVQTDFHPYTSP